MSEGHGDPPADVRSFLPRPGEPVEEYAERLRALHRDLTLVLEAVERGLAAAAAPQDLPPPVPVDVVPVDEPSAEEVPRFTKMGARVEVMPAAAGEAGRDDPAGMRRRRDDDLPPAPPSVEADEPPEAPSAGEPSSEDAPRAPHFPSRPSIVHAGERPPEPRWVEHRTGAEHLTAPTFPPAAAAPAPAGLSIPPWLVATFAAAWLVVVVLLVALLVS